MIVVNFFIQKGWINNGWLSASISMVLSLALAVISWFLVEKRALRLKAYRPINLLSFGKKV
jgi:peptidoglycan/LPS O-acetylase OafA/YrhL